MRKLLHAYNNLATAHASTNLCTTVNSDTFIVLAQPVGSSPGWLNVQIHQQMVDQGSIGYHEELHNCNQPSAF